MQVDFSVSYVLQGYGIKKSDFRARTQCTITSFKQCVYSERYTNYWLATEDHFVGPPVNYILHYEVFDSKNILPKCCRFSLVCKATHSRQNERDAVGKLSTGTFAYFATYGICWFACTFACKDQRSLSLKMYTLSLIHI